MLLAKKRMAVTLPALGAPPTAARRFPRDWVAVGLAALLCLSLRTTSTGLLVASAQREGGRVVACRYFTGTRVAERQHVVGTGGADRLVSCPLVWTRLGPPVFP